MEGEGGAVRRELPVPGRQCRQTAEGAGEGAGEGLEGVGGGGGWVGEREGGCCVLLKEKLELAHERLGEVTKKNELAQTDRQ